MTRRPWRCRGVEQRGGGMVCGIRTTLTAFAAICAKSSLDRREVVVLAPVRVRLEGAVADAADESRSPPAYRYLPWTDGRAPSAPAGASPLPARALQAEVGRGPGDDSLRP